MSQVVVSRVQSSEPGLDLEVDLPITIATIPLRKSYGMINKFVTFNELNQGNVFNNKTFVTIKHSKFCLCFVSFGFELFSYLIT